MTSSQEYDAAMDRALKYLGPRARSRREVAGVLERAGYRTAVAEGVLNRLEELSILDDSAYAQEAARQGRRKGRGAGAVKRDLEFQGIAAETIEAAVARTFPAEGEQELIFAAASKKASSLRGLPPAARYRRLAGYLARRGHDPDLVSEVCRRILGDFARSD